MFSPRWLRGLGVAQASAPKDGESPLEDPEIAQYRDLLEEPDEFVDGFGWKAVFGAIFIGVVMLPGSIYLGLVAGTSIGNAAQWVTIILFTEITRRSFGKLTRQEVFVLYYIGSTLVSLQAGLALSGGPFATALWNQFLVQSDTLKGLGIANKIPDWVSPQPSSPAIIHRTLLDAAWFKPCVVIVVGHVLFIICKLGLGSLLFRLTSDFERLPFPLAPVVAQGATALAEASGSTQETWRWRVFSMGAMMGLVWGTFYIGIPSVTGAVMQRPVELISIPWMDFTLNTETILPATPTGFATGLGVVVTALVLPFWVVVGSFLFVLLTTVLNPVLYHFGVLKQWHRGLDAPYTWFVNELDFWFSAKLGMMIAVAVIGLATMIRQLRRSGRSARMEVSRARGDIPIPIAVAMFVVSILGYVALAHYLVPDFSVLFLLGFGFLFTPLSSYVHARLQGMSGFEGTIPLVKEGAILTSGYPKVDIWFAPLPYQDFGGQAQLFRVVELTGTKMTSIFKAELLLFPLLLVCSFAFWWFIWKIAPIPSQLYPYAERVWRIRALYSSFWWTANMQRGHETVFHHAFKPALVAGSTMFGILFYGALQLLGAPALLFYGFIRGMNAFPLDVVPEIFGAMLGRFYFERRFGVVQWRLYATVLAAGFACGTGLVGIGTAAIAMISKSVSQMPF